MWLFGVPFNVYVGGQIPFYLGRLVLAPEFAVGCGFFMPYNKDEWSSGDDDASIFTHFGGYVNVNLAYYFTRDFKLTLDLGYKAWVAPTDILWSNLLGGNFHFSYGGVMIGGGIIAKI
jgi:hypothetical protein